MPRFRLIGLAPAATLRRPSRTIAHASTVAVVVPSPATSSVFLATSLTSSAPIFSYGSSSSISLAIETPSLVIVGAPHFFSSTTLRPLGPSVTRTASASLFMPASRPRRASASNAIILAMWLSSVGRVSTRAVVSTRARASASTLRPRPPTAQPHSRAPKRRCHRCGWRSRPVAATLDLTDRARCGRWPNGRDRAAIGGQACDGVAQPPATAGMMLTVWPSGTSVSRPSR